MSTESKLTISIVMWLIGLSFYCGGLYFQVNNNSKALELSYISSEKLDDRLDMIDQRLSIIQGRLDGAIK